MVEWTQRITIYKVSPGVSDRSDIRKIAVVDGDNTKSKSFLIDTVWKAFESDPMLSKIVLKRSAIPKDQAN